MSAERWAFSFEPVEGGHVPAVCRVRRMLKHARRVCGLRAMLISDKPTPTQTGPQSPQDRSAEHRTAVDTSEGSRTQGRGRIDADGGL